MPLADRSQAPEPDLRRLFDLEQAVDAELVDRVRVRAQLSGVGGPKHDAAGRA